MSNYLKIARVVGKSVLLPYFQSRYRRYRSDLKRAHDFQQQFLFDRVRRCAQTTFGREHGFEHIASVRDYQRAVPIRSYVKIKHYLDAVASGDVGALIPEGEKILEFSCTSGTTGAPKILPVTDVWLRNYQSHWQVWGTKALIDNRGIFGTYWLQLSAPDELGRTQSGQPVSMVSSVSARQQSRLLQSFYATPHQLNSVGDPELRRHAFLRIAMAQTVGFIITITASNLIGLAEQMDADKERIIREIHDGTIAGKSVLARDLGARRLERLTRADPRRAAELTRAAETHGKLYPRHVWPVQLVCCWTAGTVGYQKYRLAEYYGDAAIRDIGYVSTEGRHTIPEHNDSPLGALVPTGAFYEFEPLAAPGQILLGHELQPGEDYEVIVTTSNGLYRYRIGDIVHCHGNEGQSPVLEFVRKTADYSDIEGEKLSGDQITLALAQARELFPAGPPHMSAMAVRSEQGRSYYAFLLEEQELADDAAGRSFLNIVDRSLREMNVMYNQKRTNHTLGPPQLLLIENGSWRRFSQLRSAERRTGESQFKQPPFLEPRFLPDIPVRRTFGA